MNPRPLKPVLIIGSVVKPHHTRYTKAPEYGDIVLRGVRVKPIMVVVGVPRIATGEKFSWDYPVKVAVLDSLSEFILLAVKRFNIEPPKLNGFFQTAQTV